jgi:predicted restriction endonuclease
MYVITRVGFEITNGVRTTNLVYFFYLPHEFNHINNYQYVLQNMNNLEIYLDNYNNGELSNEIFNNYKLFDYTNEWLYKQHLKFMLANMYNIKIIEPKRKRFGQQEFRTGLLKKYNNRCVVTQQTCIHELDAAHIIPVSDTEDYDINNGLLLRTTIHQTFDKFLWSINPVTSKIEIKQNVDVGEIKKYYDVKVNIGLETNIRLKKNLQNHYEKFRKN